MAPSRDDDETQLSFLGQQYAKVEMETQKLAEELQNSRRKRCQLEAEVRFLQQKLNYFKSNPDRDRHIGAYGLNREVPSVAAYDYRQNSKPVEAAPQFYEVEVKFVDLSSLDNGILDSSVMGYPPSPSKFRREFVPHVYSR